MMSDFKAELVAGDGKRIPLEGEQRVGRSDECDITIDDPKVSRVHAVFRVKGESLTVEDLGSANGTRVNERSTSGETAVRDGDTVSFDKHSFVVALSGGAAEMEATVVGGEAADVTVVAAPEPEPPPAPEPVPEPAAPPPPPGPSDLPGSWVDSGTSDSTRVLGLDAFAESESQRVHMERASDLAHLIVVAESGEGGAALELQPGGAEEPDVWEIGRDPACEIALEEPSVSARHAQLIHQGGRWKLVNLVSANGIFVNGEKRLTAYLADGDEVRLGVATLVFRTAVNDSSPQPAAASAPAATESPAQGDGSRSKGPMLALLAAVLVAAAGAAAYFLLG